ncbi:cornifelin homolog [Lampris incognitus]|uniref:cornifelin homolog n=1 Tax=Lampris incognitus TaxID=2546036 RepID=UPI0024B5E033|nr:cornifelin homolog [Lampris incognitus]
MMGQTWNEEQSLIVAEEMAVQPSSSVVMVQPTVYKFPGEVKTGMWSSGLCDCCDDMGICCCGLWCPCCLPCEVSSDFGECLCMPLVNYLPLGLSGLIPVATLAFRSSMRERYHIQGSMCDDCCTVTFCSTCAWCQMSREIKTRRRQLSNIAATSVITEVNVNPPPYAPQFAPAAQYPPSAQCPPPVGSYTPLL